MVIMFLVLCNIYTNDDGYGEHIQTLQCLLCQIDKLCIRG